MLMGFGPFRFTVPNFSVEGMGRQSSGRVARQDVIGAAPITHILGPGTQTAALESKFHPMHMNRGGEALLAAVQLLAEQQIPHMLVSISGLVFGRWILTDVDSNYEMFAPNGRAQTITTTMTFERYVGAQGGGRLGIF